jgi:deoxyribodipyrimidine photolyase-related protein
LATNLNHSWLVDDSVGVCDDGSALRNRLCQASIFKSSRFFAAMQAFIWFKAKKHEVIYIYLNDEDNLQSFDKKY